MLGAVQKASCLLNAVMRCFLQWWQLGFTEATRVKAGSVAESLPVRELHNGMCGPPEMLGGWAQQLFLRTVVNLCQRPHTSAHWVAKLAMGRRMQGLATAVGDSPRLTECECNKSFGNVTARTYGNVTGARIRIYPLHSMQFGDDAKEY